jgi:L-cysteine:1D-myo-inositol 2-amino-2-deoxy-alpha-D-glucopyranoside ligase
MNSWPEVEIPAIAAKFDKPPLTLSDTASATKQQVANKPVYRMYVCGITPYDATHLGHAATYLTFDLINRYLRMLGSEVQYVQNITDIDDPLLERANRDGVDWRELAHQQIDLFRSDMVNLRVIPPAHYIGAVDAIPLVTQAITKLDERKSIYSVDTDLYFSVHDDEDFGSRSHLTAEQMLQIFSERGGDPARIGKRDPLDCLVWMSQRPNEPGWESPFSTGRPGWHIECTAIAIEYLTPSDSDSTLIDIQGGGSDLIFPHHEMCAAQAKVLSGKELAAHYVHAGMIGLDGEKMSKSLGNLVFVSKLVAAGRNPMAIRWALMKSRYRQDRMWNEEILVEAEMEIAQLRAVLSSESFGSTDQLIQGIISAIADDLDTPKALSLINDWANAATIHETSNDAQELLNVLDAVLGLKL